MLHPLTRIAGSANPGKFWLSMLKKYGRGVLDKDQIKWMVRVKDKGELTNREIAYAQGVSVRRVQQLYSEYRRSGGYLSPGKLGSLGRELWRIDGDGHRAAPEVRRRPSYIGRILRGMRSGSATMGCSRCSGRPALR